MYMYSFGPEKVKLEKSEDIPVNKGVGRSNSNESSNNNSVTDKV